MCGWVGVGGGVGVCGGVCGCVCACVCAKSYNLPIDSYQRRSALTIYKTACSNCLSMQKTPIFQTDKTSFKM